MLDKKEPVMYKVDTMALFGAIREMYASKDPNRVVRLSDYATPVDNQ